MRLKTEEAIYDCFLWKDGEFTFDNDTLPETIPVALPLDLTGVILEGARRTDEWQRIHEVFPSRLATFEVNHDTLEEAPDVSEEDRRVLELVARGKNLAEISLELHAVEFYAASRLLDLYERKLVVVKESPEEMDFDHQVTELRDKLDTGVSLYNAGDYENALAAFEGALEVDTQNKYARLFTLKRSSASSRTCRKSQRFRRRRCRISRLRWSSCQDSISIPQEGFVVSRVNGDWDVASITKICPMAEQEVLIIFKRLLDQGLIELEE